MVEQVHGEQRRGETREGWFLWAWGIVFGRVVDIKVGWQRLWFKV
jgi:hypothetical protein